MNEIEQLYENVGIKKKRYCEYNPDNCPYMFGHSCSDCDVEMKPEKYSYPPFTEKKQLELIKWLAIKGDFAYTVDIAKNTDAYWTIYFDDSRWTAEEFEEALAGLTNQLWQDLTEEEKEQFKYQIQQLFKEEE